tara:strand:- start:112 stop:492 length:381 start_codon:yes stop_codon:yes gene_type:complete
MPDKAKCGSNTLRKSTKQGASSAANNTAFFNAKSQFSDSSSLDNAAKVHSIQTGRVNLQLSLVETLCMLAQEVKGLRKALEAANQIKDTELQMVAEDKRVENEALEQQQKEDEEKFTAMIQSGMYS